MRRSKAGTIEQAPLIYTQKARIHNNHVAINKTSKEMARIHNHSTISKQKRYPTKTDTRQHLKQFYLVGQAPPTDIYTKPKEKGSRNFPERVVHLATAPRVPPAWCPGQLVARVSRAVRPTVRTGFLGEPFELRRYLGADGVGIWQALRSE